MLFSRFNVVKKFISLLILLFIALLFQNCSGVDSVQLESGISADEIGVVRGQNLYSQHCARCHGTLSGSSVLYRNLGQITQAISVIPNMSHLTFLNSSELQAIANAIESESGGGNIVVPPNGQRLEFACNPNSRASGALLKLTNREYRNSLNAILDDFSNNLKNDGELNNLYSLMPSDVAVQDRNTYKEQAKLITRGGVSGRFNVAYRASELIVANNQDLANFPGTNSCLGLANISQNCFRSFVSSLSSRAYRRPVTGGELDDLVNALWDTNLGKDEQIQTAFVALVQSPDFMYKAFDRGRDVPGMQNTLELTPHELASKISYFLTGSPPDSELWTLANSGQISNNTILDQQLDRLLESPGAERMIQRLFRESYGYDYFSTFDYSSNFRGSISLDGLQNAMVNELDDYFSNLVVNQNANFDTLMTSRYSSVNHNSLAQIYNISTGNGIQLPQSRAGFLNRAAMLSKRSGSRTSPIKRGLSILEHVLCVDVGLPPPSAPTSLPQLGDQVLSTRQTTERVSEVPNTSCVTCHSRINPLGYAFENFDTLGRTRPQEAIYDSNDLVQNYINIDISIATSELSSEEQRFRDSQELVMGLGQSDRAKLCFVQHLKKFESRGPASGSDFCQMNEVLASLYGQDQAGSIKDAIKTLMNSPNFKRWSY